MKMLKHVLLAVAALALAGSAAAQNKVQIEPVCSITTQNLVSAGVATARSSCDIQVNDNAVVGLQVRNTWTATGGLSLQGTVDGINWVTAAAGTEITRKATGGTSATIASGVNGVYSLNVSGYKAVRLTALGAVTGSADIVLLGTPNGGGGGGGGVGGGDASAANQTSGSQKTQIVDGLGNVVGATSNALDVNIKSGASSGAVAQGSTTAGQTGGLGQAATTTAAPTYGNGTTNPLSTTTAGALRVDGSAVTQPISASSLPLPTSAATSTKQSDGTQKTQIVDGSGNVIASTTNSLNVNCTAGCSASSGVSGATAHDAVGTSTNPVLMGGYASAAAPADVSADGDAVRAWLLRSGAQVVQPSLGGVLATAGNGVSGTGVQRVTIASDSTGQVALAAGANTIGALTANQSVNLNQVGGSAVTAGAGAVAAGTLRTTQASDSPLVTNVGAQADSAAASDTATASLLALTKRLAQNLTTVNTSITSDPNYSVTVGAGTASTRALGIAGQYKATPPTMTDTQMGVLQTDSSGNLKVNVAAGSSSGGFSTTNISCTLATTGTCGSVIDMFATGSTGLSVHIAISGTATVKIQGASDNTNFNDLSLLSPQGGGTDALTIISATTTSDWFVPALTKQVRFQVTACTSCSVTVTGGTTNAMLKPDMTRNFVQGITSRGAAASNAGAPIWVGVTGHTAAPTAVTDGQMVDPVATEYGYMVVVPNSIPSLTWSYPAASGGISNTTTAVTMKTAAGAGVRNYIDSCQVTNNTLGGATELAIRDGAAGTVLWRHSLGTAASNQNITFSTPLRGTANTLVEAVTLTAVTGGVYINCQGHTAP